MPQWEPGQNAALSARTKRIRRRRHQWTSVVSQTDQTGEDRRRIGRQTFV